MKIMRSRFLSSSAAIATAAILAFWFTFGSQVVRADDPGALASPGQEMVLVPVKTIDALEQRVKYLEKSVADLTESWQHINTHRLCVSDDSGAETCITKAQLDALLSGIAHTEIGQPPATVTEAKVEPTEQPVETVVTKDAGPASDTPAAAEEKSVAGQEPEHTGTIQSASSGAAIVLEPEVVVTEDPTPVEAAPTEPPAQSED
jgi:hypothetical protein